MCRRPRRKTRWATGRFAFVVSSMVAAAVWETAVSRSTSNAGRRRPARRRGALLIPITVRTLKSRPAAAAFREGDIDAHRNSVHDDDRNGGNRGSGARADLRSGLSDLHAGVRQDQLLRLPLHFDTAMRCVGLGPRGAMPRQSLLRG